MCAIASTQLRVNPKIRARSQHLGLRRTLGLSCVCVCERERERKKESESESESESERESYLIQALL